MARELLRLSKKFEDLETKPQIGLVRDLKIATGLYSFLTVHVENFQGFEFFKRLKRKELWYWNIR